LRGKNAEGGDDAGSSFGDVADPTIPPPITFCPRFLLIGPQTPALWNNYTLFTFSSSLRYPKYTNCNHVSRQEGHSQHWRHHPVSTILSGRAFMTFANHSFTVSWALVHGKLSLVRSALPSSRRSKLVTATLISPRSTATRRRLRKHSRRLLAAKYPASSARTSSSHPSSGTRSIAPRMYQPLSTTAWLSLVLTT